MTPSTIHMQEIADEVARALAYSKVSNEAAFVVTPLLYPGGARVVVRLAESREGFLVSDSGAGRREAELMGGHLIFTRIARETARRFAVRFDSDMIFDIEVPREALTAATMAVANASKIAVDTAAERLSEKRAADQREALWKKLELAFESGSIQHEVSITGASSSWRFDAAVVRDESVTVFEVVLPHPNAVNAAVAKFLDIRDLGTKAPGRVAVVTDREETPHLPLLGRTAQIIDIKSAASKFRRAA